MARAKRNKTRKAFLYFFLNDKIHKVLSASRSKDEVVAWCYPDKKRVMYAYSQVNKYMDRAYGITEVSQMLNKHRVTIQDYILEGKIATPSKIYPIGDPLSQTWSRYMFNQKNILDIHQHILDSGHSSDLPSKAELLGLLKHNLILYTKTEEGKFVPVWKAE
jgi:reverse gyrase